MRDRGITRPGLKAALAAAFALCGAAAIVWSRQGAPIAPEPGSPARVAANLGLVALVVGSLAALKDRKTHV